MKQTITTLFVFTISLSQPVLGMEFHISPLGNDANSGSADQPLRTLRAARDAVRKVRKAVKGNIDVFLHGGKYRISETVVFGPLDSGSNGHTVIYRAANKETPILTGGIRVTDWELNDVQKNIYRAQISGKLFRQLYVDGVSAIRARTPNQISEKDRSPYLPCIVRDKPKMVVNSEHWKAVACVQKNMLNEVEMVMVCHWYHQRVRIGEIDGSGLNEVVVSPFNTKGKFNKTLHFYKNNLGMKNPFYFENALAFLDVAYEWYHDASKGYLYLALPQGKTPEGISVEVPMIDTLVLLKGTPDSPVRNIEFHGITFECSNWNNPSIYGVNMTQAAQVIGGEQPPGMIIAKHTRKLAFRNNVFRKAGGQGISLFDADSADIEGNRFNYIAANGVMIDRTGGSNPLEDKQSVDVALWNNHATKCGSHYTNGMFLFTENVKGLIVEHNHIHDMPYSGMQIGQQPGSMRDVGAGENIIRFNHIHHCNQIHGDGGGIYTLGGIQKGTVIASNYLHDITQPKWDHYAVSQIYLDNYSSRITVRDNVVNGGSAEQRNSAKYNIFINNTQFNSEIEKQAGIRTDYNPRITKGNQLPAAEILKFKAEE